MVNIKIIRLESTYDGGTLGIMLIDDELFCHTLEPYWQDNQRNISCIPTGQYIAKRYTSEKHPNTFEVKNVLGHSFILFHIGNTLKDTDGCILLGKYPGYLNGKRAILQSTDIFNKFLEKLFDEKEFKLTIINNY